MPGSDPRPPQNLWGFNALTATIRLLKCSTPARERSRGATQRQTNAPDGFIRDVKPARLWAGSR